MVEALLEIQIIVIGVFVVILLEHLVMVVVVGKLMLLVIPVTILLENVVANKI